MRRYYARDDRALIAVAEAMAEPDAQARETAAALASDDPKLVEALLVVSGFERFSPLPLPARRPWLYRYAPLLAAAALLVFVLILARPKPQLVMKGAPITLKIAVERGAHRFTATPGARLDAGDRLGFFYSSAQPGYLAVFNRDQSGQVVPLFPHLPQSAKVAAGSSVPLPDGATVERGSGCEWFVAVFSKAPRSMEMLRKKVQAAQAGPECKLTLPIDDAQAIVSMRR